MSKKQHHHHQHQNQPPYRSGPASPGEGSSSAFVPGVPGEFESSPETERQDFDFNQFIYNEVMVPAGGLYALCCGFVPPILSRLSHDRHLPICPLTRGPQAP